MSQTTKKALAASLKKLLMNKPLSKITVTDITEDCEVNRHTFYYHFQDIYDLIDWIYETEMEKVIADNKTYETWADGVRALFRYALENKTFVLNTYHSLSRKDLTRFLNQTTYQFLIDVVNEQAHNMKVDQKHKEFIANFYKCAFVGMAIEWIDGNMKTDPDDIIIDLTTLIEGDFHKALLRFEKR